MVPELGQISIRRATKKDASVLSNIGSVTFTQSYASIILAGELTCYTRHSFSVEQLMSELSVSDIVYLLATFETIPCGYSKLEPTIPPPPIHFQNPVELVRLYVLPECVGQQIGTKLIEESLGAALDRGFCSCWLRVWRGNDRAIKFYHNRGFREIGSEPYYVGQCCETVLLMVRPLK